MRKLVPFLLGLGIAMTATANCPPLHSMADIYLPTFKGGFKFELGYLYIGPVIPDQVFATTVDAGDFNFISTHPFFDGGNYEFGIGYNFPCTANEVQVNYSHILINNSDLKQRGSFLVSDTSDLSFPVFRNDDEIFQIILPGVLSEDSQFSNHQVDFIRGVVSFSQEKIDLAFGQSLHVTPRLRFRYSGGLRGARLKNNFTTTSGINTNNDLTLQSSNMVGAEVTSLPLVTDTINITNVSLVFNDEVRQRNHFTGLGPRINLDANYYLDIGISLFASASVAALIGGEHSVLTHDQHELLKATVTSSTSDSLVVGEAIDFEFSSFNHLESPSEARIVPNLEAKLGISYNPCLPFTSNRIFIEGGYLISHYFNATDRLFEGDSESSPTRLIQDLTYDGLYIKLEMHI